MIFHYSLEYVPILYFFFLIYDSGMNADIESLCERLKLSPYQIYVLTQHGYKYNLQKVKKFGNLVYAPYRCNIPRSFSDGIGKLLFGPRADLIDTDRIIISDQRRINIKKIIYER